MAAATPTAAATSTAAAILAGPGAPGWSAEQASWWSQPCAVVADKRGGFVVADMGSHRLLRVTIAGEVSLLAGSGRPGLADGAGEQADFFEPRALGLDGNGDVLVCDTVNNCIRRVTLDGDVSTVHAFGMTTRWLAGAAADFDGNLFVTDAGDHVIWKIAPSGAASIAAGQRGSPGSADGPGLSASFSEPRGLVLSPSGALFVADCGNRVVRKVDPSGHVSVVAKGVHTVGLAMDGAGCLWAADPDSKQVRRLAVDGAQPWQLLSPAADTATSIAIDRSGNVVLCNFRNKCLHIFFALAAASPATTPTLPATLASLLESGDFTDATFSVDGQKFPVHRGILAGRSKVFKAMFASNFAEGTSRQDIEVKDATAAEFHAMLAFIYTDHVDVDRGADYLIGLARLADKYDIANLKWRCEEHLIRSLRPDNVLDMLQVADHSGLQDLRASALSFAAKHFKAVKAEAWPSVARLFGGDGLALDLAKLL